MNAIHCYSVPRLFASPANGSLKSAGRKRRAIRQDEVVRTVVKSANSPISDGMNLLVRIVRLSPVN